MLTEALSAPKKTNVPDGVREASNAQTQELIDEIQKSIDEYERLRNSEPTDVEIHSLDDLMLTPIRYRIAAHMSVDEFGRKVGVSARQIARYELEGYRNINSSTFQKILKKLNVRLNGRVA